GGSSGTVSWGSEVFRALPAGEPEAGFFGCMKTSGRKTMREEYEPFRQSGHERQKRIMAARRGDERTFARRIGEANERAWGKLSPDRGRGASSWWKKVAGEQPVRTG